MNFYQRMGILPLKKRVNRDKCSITTKQRMFGVLAINEILRYRWTPFVGSRTLCHPASEQGSSIRSSMYFVFQVLWLFLIFCYESSGNLKYQKQQQQHSSPPLIYALQPQQVAHLCLHKKYLRTDQKYLCLYQWVFMHQPKCIFASSKRYLWSTKTCNFTSLKSGPV